MPRSLSRLLMLGLGVTVFSAFSLAQSSLAPRVLVVHNTNPVYSADSLEVAQYYQAQRGIPAANMCGISFAGNEEVTEAEWLNGGIRNALRACLTSAGSTEILYIVMSYQTPFRIRRNASIFAGLDSYIGDIWDVHSATYFTGVPAAAHRYYMEAQSAGNVYGPFLTLASYRLQPRATLIYSVWRLDAPTKALARGLVDKALSAETAGLAAGGGTVYLDGRYPGIESLPDAANADHDMLRVDGMATRAGLAVVRDAQEQEFGTSPAPLTAPNAMFYTGWYSINNYMDVFTWKTGAIGWHLDSSSAYTPRSGPSWVPNALLRGITVTSGAVNEPYLEGLAHPDVVFRHLAQGGNVGDAFLRGTPWLKWMVLHVGDPLYRPFPGGLAPFNAPLAEASLRVTPNYLISGTINATLTLAAPAPPGGITVNWNNNWRGIHVNSLPVTSFIPEGQLSSTVSLNTTAPVPSQFVSVTITATYGSNVIVNSAQIFSYLAPVTIPMQVIRSGQSMVAAATLNALAPAGGMVVNLTSSDPVALPVPPSVVVPLGTRIKTFSTTAGPVSGNTYVTITATSGVYTSTQLVVVIP